MKQAKIQSQQASLGSGQDLSLVVFEGGAVSAGCLRLRSDSRRRVAPRIPHLRPTVMRTIHGDKYVSQIYNAMVGAKKHMKRDRIKQEACCSAQRRCSATGAPTGVASWHRSRCPGHSLRGSNSAYLSWGALIRVPLLEEHQL